MRNKNTKRRMKYAHKRQEREQKPCVCCGKPGSHFIGPSFGEDGFFTCVSELVAADRRKA